MRINEQIQAAGEYVLKKITPLKPTIGLVLGSGLGKFAETLKKSVTVPYGEIPGFAESKVTGHAGRLVAGLCDKANVLIMQGRVHLYEGHPISQVVLPIRTMISTGCKTIIITNASGGIRDDLKPGDLVFIKDHINLTGKNPLIG